MPKSQPSPQRRRARPTHAVGLWQVLRSLRARGHEFRRRAPYKHFILDFVSFKDRIVIDVDRGEGTDARAKAVRNTLLQREGFSVLRISDDADQKRVQAAIKDALRARRAAPMRLVPVRLAPRRAAANRSANRIVRGPATTRLGVAANPGKSASMSKRKASEPKPQRRPRGEIDRNYFFGDVLIKTGVAVAVALALIAFYTPVTLMGAIHDGMYDYLGVMGTFGVLSLILFLAGRHLRREATHWDFD